MSTSGYYTWRAGKETRASREGAERQRIREIFEESGGTYGADRVCGALRKQGHTASYGRAKRIMREEGLRSVLLSYRRSLTDSRKARGDNYPNLLRRAPPQAPLQALSSDISYRLIQSQYRCIDHTGKKGGEETGLNLVDRGRPGSKHHIITDLNGISLPIAFAP